MSKRESSISQLILNDGTDFKCLPGDTVKYLINHRDVSFEFNCTVPQNVIITGKEQGFGNFNITTTAWAKIKNVEIRNVGVVFIAGGAPTNSRNSIKIMFCDKLESTANKWGHVTVFDTIKDLSIKEIAGSAQKGDYILIKNCFMNVAPQIKDYAVIDVTDNTIAEIKTNAFQLRDQTFIFKKNVVHKVHANGFDMTNNHAQLTDNKFYDLSASWMNTKASLIEFKSNNFYESPDKIEFSSPSSTFCLFNENTIHQTNNETTNFLGIHEKCSVEALTFNIPCDCTSPLFLKSKDNQINARCGISNLERICFNDGYVSIDEYMKSSCKDQTYYAWSECGTKINAMFIGTSVGLLIVIINVSIWFYCKKKNSKSTESSKKRRSSINSYCMNSNDTINECNIDGERQKSVEIQLDFAKFKISPAPPKTNLLNNARRVKPVNAQEKNDDGYYSNDKYFDPSQQEFCKYPKFKHKKLRENEIFVKF
uniref:CSON012500 protein n=1 Tax=Culicoides sonorensis TaxID=179676 RepID=A0A336KMD5_CULSO